MNEQTPQPPFVAFKEWHVICDALISGEQQIILRKGGIAEGRDGFAFQHREFLLFPTFFHSQYEGVRKEVPLELQRAPEPDRDTVVLPGFCRIEGYAVISGWEDIQKLAPFHIWEESLLRERFDYGNHTALHLAMVKTYRFVNDLEIPFDKRYGGCRSWVNLRETELPSAVPALDINASKDVFSGIAKLLSTSILTY